MATDSRSRCEASTWSRLRLWRPRGSGPMAPAWSDIGPPPGRHRTQRSAALVVAGGRRRSARGAEPGEHAVDVALEHVAAHEVPARELVPLVRDAPHAEQAPELAL